MDTINSNSSEEKELSAGEKMFKFFSSKSSEEIREMISKKVSFGSFYLDENGFDGTLKPGYYHIMLNFPDGYEKFSWWQIKKAISEVMSELGLENGEDYAIENELCTDSICLTRQGASKVPALASRVPQGNFDYRKEIAQISLFPGGMRSLRLFASSPEGLDIVFSVANKLGLKTDPIPHIDYGKHPLEKVVKGAQKYKDEKTGRVYVSLIYFPGLVTLDDCWARAEVKKEYKDWDKKILVFAGVEDDRFEAVLNNQKVVFDTVSQPNKWMMKTREEIRKAIEEDIREEEKGREKCDFHEEGKCGKPAEFIFWEPTSLKVGVDGGHSYSNRRHILCGKHKGLLLGKAKERLKGSELKNEIRVASLCLGVEERKKKLESW
ncbi:MAG: hypothetical protein WC113_04275 [Candidatus Paceibacterota bacterium]